MEYFYLFSSVLIPSNSQTESGMLFSFHEQPAVLHPQVFEWAQILYQHSLVFPMQIIQSLLMTVANNFVTDKNSGEVMTVGYVERGQRTGMFLMYLVCSDMSKISAGTCGL